MKKIKANVNQKDRVICINVPGFQEFYYQAFGEKEHIPLFVTDFSGSVFTYFRDTGRQTNVREFYLTLKEIYQFDRFYNVKLTRVMERIPKEVDHVLRERKRVAEEIDKGIVPCEVVTNTVHTAKSVA